MNNVKENWDKFTVIVKEKDYSAREAVLFTICSFLVGFILGMLFSPKKSTTLGSYNGNGVHNDSCNPDDTCDCDCCCDCK